MTVSMHAWQRLRLELVDQDLPIRKFGFNVIDTIKAVRTHQPGTRITQGFVITFLAVAVSLSQ